MKTQHTPGPWMYEERCAGIAVTDSRDDETIVAMIIPDHDDDECSNEQEANAKLIAAAPELLEALKNLTELMLHSSNGFAITQRKEIEEAQSAIKKATL